MASTYRVIANDVVTGNLKSMIALMNSAGSTQVVSVRRIWVMNTQLVAVTGVLLSLELRRITALSAGSGILLTPQKLKTGATSLVSNITAYAGGTATETSLFRRYLLSGDEPKQNAYTMNEFQVIPNMSVLWDAGYTDSNIEPLVCRAGEGVHIKCATNSAAQNIGQIIIEFTI